MLYIQKVPVTAVGIEPWPGHEPVGAQVVVAANDELRSATVHCSCGCSSTVRSRGKTFREMLVTAWQTAPCLSSALIEDSSLL